MSIGELKLIRIGGFFLIVLQLLRPYKLEHTYGNANDKYEQQQTNGENYGKPKELE